MIITIYERMLSELQYLEEELKATQKKIRELPEGKLLCAGNGRHIKWYQSDGHNRTYIPKSNRKLAEQLAARKYLLRKEEYLLKEQKAVHSYLEIHSRNPNQAEHLMNDSSEYAKLLSPFFSPLSQELHDWMYSPYEYNNKNPEQLIHKAGSGIFVRSKSEAIIVMLLHVNRIPFRYECVLTLGDITLYPDFTIRHPRTGQTFYWEHFGMMDHPAYCKNAVSKLQLYASCGIMPSIQLITTYETAESPLSTEYVETMIKYYFS